ncbi:hypothetical protein BS78_08G017300 [Paspalum vaginatum]|nr:hypothetical protein BS78_08G017300 [Paspalum vaginatum]
MTALLGREEALLAQLIALAPPSPTWGAAATTPSPFKAESGGPPSSTTTMEDAPSCGGRRRRRRRVSARDGRGAGDEHEAAPAGAEPTDDAHYSCAKRRRKTKQQQMMSSCLVTSVPDFDGYQWRKYGQKQIEGAMYPRSYHRCTRSAEQGCQAKRTVQRNDDGHEGGAAAAKYTVVYMGEHSCTANDSMEAPVILETTVVGGRPADPLPAATTTSATNGVANSPSSGSGGGSCSATTTTTPSGGLASPAISDNDDITSWSSGHSSGDFHESSWAPAPLQEMEMGDFTGPIRSPVHVPAAPAAGMVDHQFLLQLFNEPAICLLPAGFDLFLQC